MIKRVQNLRNNIGARPLEMFLTVFNSVGTLGMALLFLRVHRMCLDWVDLPLVTLALGTSAVRRDSYYTSDLIVSHPGLLCSLLFSHSLNSSPAAGENETDNPMPRCDLHTPAVFWCCSLSSNEWKEAYMDLPCLWQKGSLWEPNIRWVRDWVCRVQNYWKFLIMYSIATFVTWGLAISCYFLCQNILDWKYLALLVSDPM